MSNYKFTLSDFHAIREAEIELNGITVLSGVNGSGKSTLSRWLYYLVNGTNNYAEYRFDLFKQELVNRANRLFFVCLNTPSELTEDRKTIVDMSRAQKEIEQLSFSKDNALEKVRSLFDFMLKNTDVLLRKGLGSNENEAKNNRLLSYLDIEVKDGNYQQALAEFIDGSQDWLNQQCDAFEHDLVVRSKDTFFNILNYEFNLNDDIPQHFQLEEDKVGILNDERVYPLLNLHTAIYIDTPMAVGLRNPNNIFWRSFHKMMIDDEETSLTWEDKKFLHRINHVLDGGVVVEKEELRAPRLRYVSSDNLVNIKLSEAATGFKTFTYMQRLLENGYLNDKTLLMIDEPEAHLHPQWIVEFARLLVQLHKTLGLKVMLASHNPDMVAAIHDIALKEGVIENTNFYVAEPSGQQTHRYNYKSLGTEVGKIFESFNIALDNIHRYGDSGLQ